MAIHTNELQHLRVKKKRLALPVFFPTLTSGPESAFWTYGITNPGALISYDVLFKKKRLFEQALKRGLKEAFGFTEGVFIMDNGAFGRVIETNPLKIYEAQRAVGADIGIILDRVAYTQSTNNEQWTSVLTTVSNAQAVVAQGPRKMLLEGVVQGVTERQFTYCAQKLKSLNMDIYGVGVSYYITHGKYREGIEKVRRIREVLGGNSVIHALGCGSRSYLAILGALGVGIFDSLSYFYSSIYRQLLKPITMCAMGEVRPAHPLCDACLKPTTTRPAKNYFVHNLTEILKEAERTQCALRAGTMESYLQRRLSAKYKKAVEGILL
jgi:tRNA-guanine family transglycosylase